MGTQWTGFGGVRPRRRNVARRWSRVESVLLAVIFLSVCILVAGGLGCGGGASTSRAESASGSGAANPSASGAAVVYTRFTPPAGPWTILWRPLSSSAETVVHVVSTSKSMAMGRYGYLPSPDGRHLLIWKADAHPDRPGSPESPDLREVVTHWLVQPLPTGRPVEIGQTEGLPLLLPHWVDGRRVELDGDVTLGGDRETTVFDLGSGKLSRPLRRVRQSRVYESGVAQWVARARLEVYAQRHLLPELACLYRALNLGWPEGIGGPPPGISEALYGELAEPPEYLLLRATGIPGLGGLDSGPPYHRPQFTCAPDRSAVAYAWVYQQSEERSPSAIYGTDSSGKALKPGVYARIDVHRFSAPHQRVVLVTQWPGARPLRTGGLIPRGPTPVFPDFSDLRWSMDGHYLSFSQWGQRYPTVRVFDTSGWNEVLAIPHAHNAFVILD